MDKYDFDAPSFQDFNEIGLHEPVIKDLRVVESEEAVLEKVTENEPDEDAPDSHLPDERPVAILAENTPSSSVAIKAYSHKTGARPKHRATPFRQSPRLAAIAKEVRRENASRGFVSSPRNHRRSLSEGSSIPTNFTKVAKSSVHKRKGNVPFATGKRLRGNSSQSVQHFTEPGVCDPEKNFTTSLRAYSNQQQGKASTRGPTKVQPFNLHAARKPAVAESFVSIAEMNLKFQTATPKRFRTRKANAGFEPQSSEATGAKGGTKAASLTQPQTPALSARLRSRPVHHPTREEAEIMEAEQMQKHKFKARPLNKKIFEQPKVVEANPERAVCVPEPFNITDMKKKQTVECIVGKDIYQSKGDLISSSSLAHGHVSQVEPRRKTEVKPFSFDARDAEMMTRKKKKIEKLIEEERQLAEFRAQPMPVLDQVVGVPQKTAIPATQPKPFQMAGDGRRAAKLKEIEEELKSMREMEKKQREFRSQPPKSVINPPFVPAKSDKPLTDISSFTLNSERRAAEREEFDAYLKLKEAELMRKKEELEESKKKAEEEEVKRLRKEAVHKAQPVKHYKGVEVKRGLIQTTVPVTPSFAKPRAKSVRSVDSEDATFTRDAAQELTFDNGPC